MQKVCNNNNNNNANNKVEMYKIVENVGLSASSVSCFICCTVLKLRNAFRGEPTADLER